MFDYKSDRARCNTCGAFMKWQEPGASWVFVPDSAVSHEECKDQCKKCTDKYGMLVPHQSVNVGLCSGIYKETEND